MYNPPADPSCHNTEQDSVCCVLWSIYICRLLTKNSSSVQLNDTSMKTHPDTLLLFW